MHAAIKLIVGIIVLLAGLYWYAAPLFGHMGIQDFLFSHAVASTFGAFVTVFAGLFGLFLIFLGVIVAWIEFEDLKWAAREKAGAVKETIAPSPEPASEVPKRRRGRPRKGEVV